MSGIIHRPDEDEELGPCWVVLAAAEVLRCGSGLAMAVAGNAAVHGASCVLSGKPLRNMLMLDGVVGRHEPRPTAFACTRV